MNKVDKWFPTSIYNTVMDEFETQRNSFISKAYELKNQYTNVSDWNCDTYSTLDTPYNLKDDPLFGGLIATSVQHVENFAKVYGVENPSVQVTNCWINIASPGNYQEYHMHADSHFSAVYYVDVNKDCGNIVFKSAEANTDMYPVLIDTPNGLNHKTCFYTPENNKLIIFRSNLLHMVKTNLSEKDRISISLNYTILKRAHNVN